MFSQRCSRELNSSGMLRQVARQISLGRRSRGLEDNIKVDLKQNEIAWIGLIYVRTGTNGVSPSMHSLLFEELSASPENSDALS